MRLVIAHFWIAASFIAASPTAVLADEPVSSLRLCDFLGTLAPGEHREVKVEGVYVESMEGSVFYAPGQPVCVMDVAPATWVEFVSGYAEPASLRAELRRSGRAWVRFTGTLWGRGELPPDDPNVPPMVAYASRIGNLRYGHMNAYPTKLVVGSAEFVKPVDKSEPSYGAWSRERPGSAVPILISSQVPQYPESARKVGMEGVVVAEVEVKNGLVAKRAVKSGDRLLAEAVLETIATWRFGEGESGSFSSVFVFELHSDRSGSDKNPQLDLRLPTFARISAPRHGW